MKRIKDECLKNMKLTNVTIKDVSSFSGSEICSLLFSPFLLLESILNWCLHSRNSIASPILFLALGMIQTFISQIHSLQNSSSLNITDYGVCSLNHILIHWYLWSHKYGPDMRREICERYTHRLQTLTGLLGGVRASRKFQDSLEASEVVVKTEDIYSPTTTVYGTW